MWQVFRSTANKTTFIGFSFTVYLFHSFVLHILLQYSESYNVSTEIGSNKILPNK